MKLMERLLLADELLIDTELMTKELYMSIIHGTELDKFEDKLNSYEQLLEYRKSNNQPTEEVEEKIRKHKLKFIDLYKDEE